MSTLGKELSNPFSTGGGGVNFETRVQAAFSVLMLTGGFVPCLPTWPIKKIKLQGKHDGYDVDDLIIFLQNPNSNKTAKLLGQIKHSISITEGNKTFGDVIRSAWIDFQNSNIFSQECDVIALITGPLSATDIGDVRQILEWARHAEDANDFIDKVDKTKFSSNAKRNKLRVFRVHLKNANGGTELTDAELWSFMKCFHLLGYDLDIKSGVTHSLLHSLIGQYSQDNAAFIWAKTLEEVQSANQNAATLVIDSFSTELIEAFKVKVPQTIPVEFTVMEKISRETNWPQHKYATDLALAALLGAWNDASIADKTIIEELTQGNYNDWIDKIRDISFQVDSPIKQKDGKWQFVDRNESWQTLAVRFFDAHLDRFHEIAVKVLSELDPKFELPPEERYAASIHRKILLHSSQLRKGIAESLALLGSNPKILTSCSKGKAEYITAISIREILTKADQVLWGSLNTLLPLLAEAAPDEFFDAIEASFKSVPCPFDVLIGQKSNGIMVENYMTGLYWGLESLAWHEEYLVRATVALGFLANYDPDGNSGNRPSESLSTIYLPWLPQTTASVEKRIIAVETLTKESPDVAWKLLLFLLPTVTSFSSGTYKPIFRNPIPEERPNVTEAEYQELISVYTERVCDIAISSDKKLIELIDYFDNLLIHAQERILAHLSSEQIQNLDENEKFDLWLNLSKFITKHRRFSDAKWAMPLDQIEKIYKITEKLSPTDPILKYHRLFSEQDFELYEDMGDYKEQGKRLEERRKKAIEEIYNVDGLKYILSFIQSIQLPERVGYIFGLIFDEDDLILPDLIESDDKKDNEFTTGYVWARYQLEGWNWVNGIEFATWSKESISQFLAYLPFSRETWNKVKTNLNEDEELYWTKTNVNPFDDVEGLEFAIDKLVAYGRPNEALNCLENLRHNKKKLNNKQIFRTLRAILRTKERANSMDVYYICEQIKVLQENIDTDQDELFNIEWAYLPILEQNHLGTPPVTLERRLVDNPDFFCEAVQAIFRSKNEDGPIEAITEEKKKIASNAYNLLRRWSTPPGTDKNGLFDGVVFTKWVDMVKSICSASGHLEVALSMMGNVLIHAPEDPNGLWLHTAVAEALNDKDAEDMRKGYRTALFNSRGVHWVDPEGKEEHSLADKYHKQAEQVEGKGYHRLANTLNKLAASYKLDAE